VELRSYKYLFNAGLDFIIHSSGNRRKLCVTERQVRVNRKYCRNQQEPGADGSHL
jgi:hypothetical protein